ncbi:MAG: phospholipid carrier-dependent glycosyltransferase [Aeromicrobium erythreum]
MGRIRGLRWDWLGPLSLTVLALVLRLWNLGRPNRLIFDETYYAKDAYSLRRFGYVRDFTEGANAKIADGRLDGLFTNDPSWIVHPDGGKWLIAGGEWLFGMNSFGWRFSAALVGSLTVLLLARLVLRLTGSTWIACLAGLLLCLDGMHLVMSRTALLDVFLTFWLVAAVACLVADRDWIDARLDGPRRLFRPWQLAAGLCFGMAVGTKWSAVWVLAVLGVATVGWELVRRRDLRAGLWVAPLAFVTIVGTAFVVYLATWSGFLLHADLYEQRFGLGYGDYPPWGAYVEDPTGGPFGGVVDAFRSLWHFHVMTYDFHTGSYLAGKTHPYASDPAGWLVLDRPVAFDAQNDLPAASCGAPADSSCMREITALGNPAVWWTGSVAVLVAVVAWVRTVLRDHVTQRDARWAGPLVVAPLVLAVPATIAVLVLPQGARTPVAAAMAIVLAATLCLERRWSIALLGVASTWLPWFLYDDRPIFSFYAVTTLPFLVLATCLVVDALRRRAATPRQRAGVAAGVGVLVGATVALFVYFHPILTDALVPYQDWYARMWFGRRWI